MVCGCATLRGQATAALDAGDYVHAAELYDQILSDDPHDQEALHQRDAARMSALRQSLFRAEAARASGANEDAGADLLELLGHRNGWSVTLDPRMDAPLAAEIAAHSTYLAATVAERTRRAGPLAGEALARQHRGLLDLGDFAAAHAQISNALAAAAQARCADLPSTTPYLGWLVADYCTHFGAERTAPVPPNLYASVDLEGGIAGSPDDSFRQAVRTGFTKSVWFAPGASASLHASLDGSISTSFTSQAVTLHKHYTVEVPYTDYETQQQSYQVPYTETTYTTEQVPETTTNADGSSSTSYTTQSVPQTTTSFRTETQDVTVPVTKYTTEDRDYAYDAIEEDGTYASSAVATFDALGMTAAARASFTQYGYDSNASSAEAGLEPQQANLTTADGFASDQRASLRDEVAKQLDEKYLALYCTEVTYTPEQAAACSYLDVERAPDAVHTALREVFGGDEPYLATIAKR
jgi:hypothetical protein